MRLILAFAILLLVSPQPIFGFQHSNDWITYDSKEGRYSIQLPKEPTVGSQEATSADGVKFTQHSALVTSGNASFQIGYFDYSPETSFSLDKARDGMVSAVNGTLLTERTVTLGKYLGRELRIAGKVQDTEFVARARIFDVDRRVYILQLIGPKSDETSVDAMANRYFGSFQVVNAPATYH